MGGQRKITTTCQQCNGVTPHRGRLAKAFLGPKKCSACNGTPRRRSRCTTCSGEGTVEKSLDEKLASYKYKLRNCTRCLKCQASGIQPSQLSRPYKKGDRVEVNYRNQGTWYRAVVSDYVVISQCGYYDVIYDNNNHPATSGKSREKARLVEEPRGEACVTCRGTGRDSQKYQTLAADEDDEEYRNLTEVIRNLPRASLCLSCKTCHLRIQQLLTSRSRSPSGTSTYSTPSSSRFRSEESLIGALKQDKEDETLRNQNQAEGKEADKIALRSELMVTTSRCLAERLQRAELHA